MNFIYMRLKLSTQRLLLERVFIMKEEKSMLLSHFSHVRLWDPIDGSPPGSPVPGILQARTLEWVAISFSNAWKWKVKVKLLSRCLTLSNPMDWGLPGSSIHGIFQARVLEWGAIAFSGEIRRMVLMHNIPKKKLYDKINYSIWKKKGFSLFLFVSSNKNYLAI